MSKHIIVMNDNLNDDVVKISITLNDNGSKTISFNYLGNCIGHSSVILNNEIGNNFLYDVFVPDESRGNGYGKAITKYMIQNYNVCELWVAETNEIAISLYKSLGFHETGKKYYNDNENLNFIWMEL